MQAWHCGPPVSYGGRHGQGEVGARDLPDNILLGVIARLPCYVDLACVSTTGGMPPCPLPPIELDQRRDHLWDVADLLNGVWVVRWR
ncbi:hypothetical protein OsI_26474 [Oryza sativa Indica Group]|uniref:Uncharacterized protein n=1 Tax=Oryza sativa subsp. indica TaxID=39946 RepID=B8B7G1_ORYSI|nr:hypothetical protein OsI_26474 [Oryza sativa Indica Group]